MTESEIKARIHKLIRKEVPGARHRETLDAADRFAALGARDLDLLHIIFAIEDEHDLHITDEEAESLQTVGDLERLVLEKVGIGV
ncbi:MAG TPA: hypothetical protein VJP88_05230 [Caulobacteraceae bacterium]|nr:hypothetical protein [Caulobacteraceae bacterium]